MLGKRSDDFHLDLTFGQRPVINHKKIIIAFIVPGSIGSRPEEVNATWAYCIDYCPDYSRKSRI